MVLVLFGGGGGLFACLFFDPCLHPITQGTKTFTIWAEEVKRLCYIIMKTRVQIRNFKGFDMVYSIILLHIFLSAI